MVEEQDVLMTLRFGEQPLTPAAVDTNPPPPCPPLPLGLITRPPSGVVVNAASGPLPASRPTPSSWN
jgi:hypothetical protein